jgi:diacylglycerol kinase family enzyme
MLAMAGIGQDAVSVQRVRPGLKRRWGWLAYAESGVRSASGKPQQMQVSIDDLEPWQVQAWSILAANCSVVPGNTVVFPDAQLDSGKLALLRVNIDSPVRWAGVAAKGLVNFAADVPGLSYREGTRMEVRTSGPVPVQIDGDLVAGVTGMRVTIRPQATTVRVPAAGSGYSG